MTATSLNLQNIWVGLWHEKRHVVFDPSIQPDNADFMFLYFVEGHSLCARKRTTERKEVTTVVNPDDRDFALAQYAQWFSANMTAITEKQSLAEFEIDNPPPPRKKCPECDGQGTWFDTVNKCTYGVNSEGANIIERCPSCKGHCFVADVLKF